MNCFPYPLLIAAALIVCAGVARADEPPADAAQAPPHAVTVAPAQTQVDDRSATILDQLASFYKKVQGFDVDVHVNMTAQRFGQTHHLVREYSFATQRPNKFALRLTNEPGGPEVVSNPQGLFMSLGTQANRYSQQPTPESFDKLGENGLIGMVSYGTGDLVSALMGADPRAAMLRGVTAVTHVGTEKVGEVEAERLHFEVPRSPFDMWLSTGDQPRILRVVPDVSAALTEENKDLSIEVAISFRDWNLNPEHATDAFAFTPPDGATKVDDLFAPPPHPLVGKAAPDFTLNDLSGNTVKLADLRGKKVVVLDFWATWCGPCVKAMPIISEVTAGLAEKGVVLYAVNIQEQPAAIEAFLKEHELDVNVLLDADATVARRYGARSIPQTVIIDKDGKISTVHVGLSADLKEQLTADLTKLVK